MQIHFQDHSVFIDRRDSLDEIRRSEFPELVSELDERMAPRLSGPKLLNLVWANFRVAGRSSRIPLATCSHHLNASIVAGQVDPASSSVADCCGDGDAWA